MSITNEKQLFESLVEWIGNCEKNVLDNMFDEDFLVGMGLSESAVTEFLESGHTGTVRAIAEPVVRAQMITLAEFVMLNLAEFASATSDDNVINRQLKSRFNRHMVRRGLIVG